jgi:hypothetical protein
MPKMRHGTRREEKLKMKHLIFALLILSAGILRAADSLEEGKVKSVLAAYNLALTTLDAARAKDLFSADSAVFESGGVEGSYAHYLEHHIGPELAEFKEFSYRDYTVEIRFELPLALTTESYIYRIVIKEGGEIIEKRAATTSVLKKFNGEWKIIQSHTSSRAIKNN